MVKKKSQRKKSKQKKGNPSTAVPRHVVVESTSSSPSHVSESAEPPTVQSGAGPSDPTHRPPSGSPTLAAPVSYFKGAMNTTINNPIINNVARDATIFKFDGDGPLSEEFRSLFVNHLAGMTVTQNVCAKMENHVLSQSICNLPRAKAAYDDYAYKDKKRVSCFENTRETLRKEIGEWITATLDKPEIYLLSGLAGIGKSTVAQTVAERADNLHLLCASFFFSRDEADRRNAEKFYTSIAFQLCAYDKQFAQAIGKVLREEKGASATSKEPREQLDALIIGPLRGLLNQHSQPLVIIVDALDECDEEDALIILETLEHLVHELPSLRVVLTSRPRPLLDGYFDNHRVFHMHNIEDRVVDNDIRLYLKHRLSREQVKSHFKLKTQWSANEKEIENLVQAAGRLFIIASTAVLFILDKAALDPASQMEKLQTAFAMDRSPFDALKSFYTIILRSAVPTCCDDDIVERYQKVIGTIAHVQEPLAIQALADLIDLKPEAVRAVLFNLQSVILLGDNDIPRVYHKSFLDYLRDAKRCKDDDLRIVPKDQHTQIAVCCFDIMNMRLKRNILGLGTPAQYTDNNDALEAEGISDDRLREKIAPELRYACVYWANHFEGVDTDINLIKKVDVFAKEHLLYWLEALSWICKLELAPRALFTVHSLLKPTSSDTREILFDAFRLVSKDYYRIRQSALHIYHSALPFTPTKTLLPNVYKKDDHCQLGGGPERWDALVAVPTYGAEERVYRIAFSLDSSRLASWTRYEMKLWDASSGVPVKTFNGDRITLTGDFSIVALSKDNTLTLYNVATNAPVANYNIPSAGVVELALSFDGSRLAAGLSDGTVRLWDGRGIGKPIASLDGYNCYGPLEFAPSGYHLAFLSDGGGIQLWNGFDGESIASMGYGYPEFVFSHSGSRLAALTRMENLTLWNGENGDFIGTEMDVRFGWPLAISDDAFLMIAAGLTASGGMMVQLWSGDSLSLVDTLEIGDQIESLAFSQDMLAIGSVRKVTFYDLQTRAIITSVKFSGPDSLALSPSRLAVITAGCEVHLLDVQSMKASASESVKIPRIVTALTFSPDCLRLASGFRDGTVELWDTGRTEQVIATLKHHSHGVTLLAFSVDGEQLASGSMDKTVRLWGGRDGAPIGILEHTFHEPLTSLAFSNRLLAAQTRDNLTVFDCKTLRPIHTFDAGGHQLSFSLGGSLLACMHDSWDVFTPKTDVTLWDVESRMLLACMHDSWDVFTPKTDVTLWDVESRMLLAQFKTTHIQQLVFSPDNSRLAALTPHGFEFFDLINKHTIASSGHEEISWIFQNGPLISQPSEKPYGRYSGYGEPLLGHFPEHHGGVPILWMQRDVGISAFSVASSTFALGCDDGRLLIGHVPPALATS